MKVLQPYRNSTEYRCFLEGVTRTAALFGLKVDAASWGGGIPIDLTLYQVNEKPKPEPVVVADLGEDAFEKPKKRKGFKKKKKLNGESDSRT